jgi:hypothetical protein
VFINTKTVGAFLTVEDLKKNLRAQKQCAGGR